MSQNESVDQIIDDEKKRFDEIEERHMQRVDAILDKAKEFFMALNNDSYNHKNL